MCTGVVVHGRFFTGSEAGENRRRAFSDSTVIYEQQQQHNEAQFRAFMMAAEFVNIE